MNIIFKWKRILRYILIDFFASGLSDTNDVELIRKTNMLNAIGVVGILALAPLGIDAIRLGNPIVGWFDVFTALLLLIEIVYLRIGTHYKFVINAGITAAGSLFFYLMLSQWMGGAAFLWYFTFPLLTSFLLGSKKGFWVSALLISATVVLFISAEYLGIKMIRTSAFETRFVMAYIVVAVFAYAFEKTRENTQENVIKKNNLLNTKIAELEAIKDELERSNRQLDKRVSERTIELSEANILLDNEVKEKEILLKEIHHRVKNNLQIISSLLYLQSQSLTDEYSKALFKDSQNRILSMAMVHENLYQADDLAKVNIRDYLKNLTTELLSSYTDENSAVDLTLGIDPVPLTIEKAIPLGLIINELVSNALKYAFNDFSNTADNHNSEKKERRIKVLLKQKKASCTQLIVADNGRGIPSKINFKESPSLGLQLVNSLINQLGGTVVLKNDNGAYFDISFSVM